MIYRGRRKDGKGYAFGLPAYGENGEIDRITQKDGKTVEIIPSSLGRNTGFFDKHGREIFVGDIVKLARGHIGMRPFICKELDSLDREYELYNGFEPKTFKARLNHVIAFIGSDKKNDSFTILPRVDENGNCNTEDMEIVRTAPPAPCLTNREWLNSLSDSDMAAWLHGLQNYPPQFQGEYGRDEDNPFYWEKWLQKENEYVNLDGCWQHKREVMEDAEFYRRCGTCANENEEYATQYVANGPKEQMEYQERCDECRENSFKHYRVCQQCESCKHLECDRSVWHKTPCCGCRENHFKNRERA